MAIGRHLSQIQFINSGNCEILKASDIREQWHEFKLKKDEVITGMYGTQIDDQSEMLTKLGFIIAKLN